MSTAVASDGNDATSLPPLLVVDDATHEDPPESKAAQRARADSEATSTTGLSMELQLERMRVHEALCARDVVVERLAEACTSVRQKNGTIDRLLAERVELLKQLSSSLAVITASDPSPGDAVKLDGFSTIINAFKDSAKRVVDDLAGSEVDLKEICGPILQQLVSSADGDPLLAAVFRDIANKMDIPPSPNVPGPGCGEPQNSPKLGNDINLDKLTLQDSKPSDAKASPAAIDPAQQIAARNAILAALPLPSDILDDALRPIVIPSPYTLHEFIGTTPASLRTQLGNYRVFQQTTTAWCPEREEHGYFLAPVFKCSTNPRVSTAHRWTVVDLASKLNRPTECFYNRDGKWYYAGIYKAFRLDDLSTQEWEKLSTETSQALIKETLAARKNTSPQNVYETGQLYAVGALRLACIGLQCIGFNNALYRTILEHAAKCAQTGKWRNNSSATSAPAPWAGNASALSPNAASVAAGASPNIDETSS